jgi:hypothetical protein
MGIISLARPGVASSSRFTFAQVNDLLSSPDFAAIRDAFRFSQHFKERLTSEQLETKLKAVAVSSFDSRGKVSEVKLWRGVNSAFRQLSADAGEKVSARQAEKLIKAGIEEHCDVMDRAGKIEARAAELGIQVRDVLAMDRLSRGEAKMTDMAQVERLVRLNFVTSEYEAWEVKVALTRKFEEEFGNYINPQAKKAGTQKIVAEPKKQVVKAAEPAVAAPKVKKENRLFRPVAIAKALAVTAVVGFVVVGITFLTSVLSPPPVSNAKEDAKAQKPAVVQVEDGARAAGRGSAGAVSAGAVVFENPGNGLFKYHFDPKMGAAYRLAVTANIVNNGNKPLAVDGAVIEIDGKSEKAVIIGGPFVVRPGESKRFVGRGPHMDGPVPYGQEKIATVELDTGAAKVTGTVKCKVRDYGSKPLAKSYAKGRPVSEVLSTPELMLNLVGAKLERQILALHSAGLMQQDAKLMHLVEQFQTNTGARKGRWLQGQIEEHLKNLAKEIHGA